MSWDRATTGRLALVLLALALAYALALWQPVRAWYSDADKLAHALVFAGVYLALAWALRWPALPLALLSLALRPDGQVKFPHPWPPQIPPGRTPRL